MICLCAKMWKKVLGLERSQTCSWTFRNQQRLFIPQLAWLYVLARLFDLSNLPKGVYLSLSPGSRKQTFQIPTTQILLHFRVPTTLPHSLDCNTERSAMPYCKVDDCWEVRTNSISALFCRTHECLWTPCARGSEINAFGRYCHHHNCLVEDCIEPRVDALHSYCILHKCMQDDCGKIRSVASFRGTSAYSNYCSEHTCDVVGCEDWMILMDFVPPMRVCSKHASPKNGD